MDNRKLLTSRVVTNNDLEGWHKGLNEEATRPKLGFYQLVHLMKTSADHLVLHTKLVKEGKLCRLQRKQQRRVEGKLFTLWLKYENGELSTSRLLAACSRVYAPRM